MDSLGEVGKKMRSAIKAKLVELGNASSTGYIDDELPDYVMIMVANKRPKQQMLNDLNLFLGSNTESFVNWLHQVLQKLQEVTLPSSLASKAKKKISDSSKKDKKKDKKKNAKEPSITDVIAVELMEKAKKTIDPKVKDEESKTPSPPPAPLIAQPFEAPTPPRMNSSSHVTDKNQDDDEFDIPTISEIATSANNKNLHKKELSQLQELQNRIYQTKRKLETLSSTEKESDKEESPEISNRRSKTPEPQKKSIKSRLGVKPTENSKPSNIISLSAIRKKETELYNASTFRKLIEKQKEDNERRDDRSSGTSHRNSRIESTRNQRRDHRRSRSNSRHRNRERARRRSRSRSPIRSQDRRSKRSIHERIGSRVNSSQPSKTPENDIKPKPKQRPTLNSAISAQLAGKSLLLRAVAEAQRSTKLASTEKKPRDNIVVHVNNQKRNAPEEYIPESISGHSESEAEYHPSHKRNQQDNAEDEDDVVYLNNVDLDDLDDNNMMPDASKDENSKSSHSPTPPPVIRRRHLRDRIGFQAIDERVENRQPQKRQLQEDDEECESQRAYNKAKKTRVSPIKFDLTDDENECGKSRSSSCDRAEKRSLLKQQHNDSESRMDHNGEEHAKRIKLEASRSFDHVPQLLSSIAVPVDGAKSNTKQKERCKYYPSCTNLSCGFYHPTLPCKIFPNCKYGDSCAYTHPQCKFDVSCNRINCNFTHTPIIAQSSPLIASSIVPVQNYKSIQVTPNSTVCKFFPSCTNTNCIYLHPKICKFGKTCANKYECNFYHFETSSKSKFKWISPLS